MFFLGGNLGLTWPGLVYILEIRPSGSPVIHSLLYPMMVIVLVN